MAKKTTIYLTDSNAVRLHEEYITRGAHHGDKNDIVNEAIEYYLFKGPVSMVSARRRRERGLDPVAPSPISSSKEG